MNNPVKRLEEVKTILTDAVARGDIPCAVALAGTADHQEVIAVEGVRRYGGREDSTAVTLDTYFDLASLTKVVATLPSILYLVTTGALSLEDKVGAFF